MMANFMVSKQYNNVKEVRVFYKAMIQIEVLTQD